MVKIMSKPEKRTYRKGKVFLIIVVVIFLIWVYLNSPYTHVEERKIINYALHGSRSDFKFLRISQSSGLIGADYTVLERFSYDAESFFEIRLRMKKYLEENPDYFINVDHKGIALSWVDNRSGGPLILRFLNVYGIDYGGSGPPKIIKQFDSLDCLIISEGLDLFSLSDISDYTLYEDIKGLILSEYAYIEDIEIL